MFLNFLDILFFNFIDKLIIHADKNTNKRYKQPISRRYNVNRSVDQSEGVVISVS